MKSIFVSHAKDDKSIAKKLVSKLESTGLQCYVASRDKASGKVDELIENSTVFIFILSKSAQNSVEISNHLKLAVDHNCHIIPFKNGNIENSLGMQYILHSLEWVDAHGDGFDEAYEILLEIIEELSDEKVVKPKKAKKTTKQVEGESSIQKSHLYIIIGILSAILIYLLVFKDSSSEKSSTANNNTSIQNNTPPPDFVNSDLKSDEQIIVGSWRMTDYEDSRAMSAEERRVTEQNIEAMKQQVLLSYNANRTFERTGFTPDVQRGYWEYDSKKRKIYLTPENTNKKEEINILNLNEKEMTIVVTELVQDQQGNQETVTTKITFQKQ